jgi:hypothetical protein
MAFVFFTVPIQDNGREQEELNAFLRSHKILSVDRRWVEQGASSFWNSSSPTAKKQKLDKERSGKTGAAVV